MAYTQPLHVQSDGASFKLLPSQPPMLGCRSVSPLASTDSPRYSTPLTPKTDSVRSTSSAASSCSLFGGESMSMPVNPLSKRVTVGLHAGHEEALVQLNSELDRLKPFFPIGEIVNFRPDQKFLHFRLEALFKQVGYAFAFLPAVRTLLQEKFGRFDSTHPPELKGTVSEKIDTCQRLLSMILPTAADCIDQSLCKIWKRIVEENRLGYSQDLTAQEIRTAIQSDNLTISHINLRELDIQILPLDILALQPQSLDLRGTKITHIPGDVIRKVDESRISRDRSQLVELAGLEPQDL